MCRTIVFSLMLCFTVLSMAAQDFSDLKRSSKKGPLLLEVENVLLGKTSLESAKEALLTVGDLNESYKAQSPIYTVLEVLATRDSTQTKSAEEILRILVSRDDFTPREQYSSLGQCFNFLLSRNAEYLQGRKDKRYISSNILWTLLKTDVSVDVGALYRFAVDREDGALMVEAAKRGLGGGMQTVLYQMIRLRNLPQLKALVESGQIELRLNDFLSDDTNFDANIHLLPDTALYQYVANKIAVQVEDRAGVYEFYKRFPLCKESIDIETIAQKELTNADFLGFFKEVENKGTRDGVFAETNYVKTNLYKSYRSVFASRVNVYDKFISELQAGRIIDNTTIKEVQQIDDTVYNTLNSYDPDNLRTKVNVVRDLILADLNNALTVDVVPPSIDFYGLSPILHIVWRMDIVHSIELLKKCKIYNPRFIDQLLTALSKKAEEVEYVSPALRQRFAKAKANYKTARAQFEAVVLNTPINLQYRDKSVNKFFDTYKIYYRYEFPDIKVTRYDIFYEVKVSSKYPRLAVIEYWGDGSMRSGSLDFPVATDPFFKEDLRDNFLRIKKSYVEQMMPQLRE